jgi:hypothetical protein
MGNAGPDRHRGESPPPAHCGPEISCIDDPTLVYLAWLARLDLGSSRIEDETILADGAHRAGSTRPDGRFGRFYLLHTSWRPWL